MTSGRSCRAVRAATFAATCVLLAAVGHLFMSGAPVAWPGLATAFAVTGAAAWSLTGRERTLGAVTAATIAVQAGLHAAFSLTQAVTMPRAPDVSLLRLWTDHLLCRPPSAPPTAGDVSHASAVHTLAGHAEGHGGHGPGGSGAASHGVDGAMSATGQAHHAATGQAHHTAADHLPHGAVPGGLDPAAVPQVDLTAMSSLGMSPAGMLAAHLLAGLLCGLWLAHGERAVFRALRAIAGWLAAPLHLVLRLAPPAAAAPGRVRRRRTAARLRRLLLAASRDTRGPPSGIAVI
ncbi:hypothetical protein QNO07_06925 [Streptomyces sp. 549]|uniref:hypothetical protein n=1 Tax=Streptomyces sp. 549 TaxID=3049076 RepID=UPI0024C3E30F|nr:hypothetical protein [Streptomyces sp. 549]MDK1473155.1 hypothetical protein [Streptomyces sp. 549]